MTFLVGRDRTRCLLGGVVIHIVHLSPNLVIDLNATNVKESIRLLPVGLLFNFSDDFCFLSVPFHGRIGSLFEDDLSVFHSRES